MARLRKCMMDALAGLQPIAHNEHFNPYYTPIIAKHDYMICVV